MVNKLPLTIFFITCDKKMYILLIENVIVIVLYLGSPLSPGLIVLEKLDNYQELVFDKFLITYKIYVIFLENIL